ncbi:antibiotic biosynthesis monooxygenase family protein [Amycolatopsis thailandensis]|uniref:antibiotic biosynthesis monooxygenase family protein n=1 Tax=Amycolatopsis thailandensis TaxID=589330 RepID=UPI0037BD2993
MPPTAGFRVMLTMRIHPGRGAEFEQAWRAAGAAVSGHPANLGHRLYLDGGTEDLYYICSDWIDEEQFRAFENSPAHLEHREKLHPYRAEGSIAMMRAVGGAA